MTTQQMIENAMLDALGLLSVEEQREFERAFWSASPAVQAHVRREQTRLSRIESLLPKVEPPADLRAAVVQAVREAMIAQLAEPAEETSERGPIPLLSSLHVSPVWRAASLGFAAAAAVFGATTLFMWGQYRDVDSQMRNNAFGAEIAAAAGADAMDLLFGYGAIARFQPVAEGGVGQASFHYLSESGEGLLTVAGLPALSSGEYAVVLINDEGEQVADLAQRFASEGGSLRLIKLDLAPEHDGLRLALVSTAGDREPMFVSEALRLA